MRFFLNNSFYTISVCVLFLTWTFGTYSLLILSLLVIGGIAFFMRRISPHYQQDVMLKEGVFYAPVNGRVKKIKNAVSHPHLGDNLTEITFSISWLRECGLYLPTRCEVLELYHTKGKSLFRYFFELDNNSIEKYSGVFLKFISIGGEQKEYGIQVVKCSLGMWPSVRVIPGDRGRAQVNFGFLGLGGTVLLYLPSQFEILVKNGQLTAPGQTIIAARTEDYINTNLNNEE